MSLSTQALVHHQSAVRIQPCQILTALEKMQLNFFLQARDIYNSKIQL